MRARFHRVHVEVHGCRRGVAASPALVLLTSVSRCDACLAAGPQTKPEELAVASRAARHGA